MSLTLSPEIQKIIDDWYNHKLILPAWFANNNVNWLISGHITESEFFTAFNNLLNSGIAYYVSTPEPEPAPAPIYESVKTYWILPPSQQPSGTVEQITITESSKQKFLSKGYIFSTRKPVYSRGLILWFTQDTQFPTDMHTNQSGELYTTQLSPITEPIPPPPTEPIPPPPTEPIPPAPAPPIIEIPEVIAEPEIDTSITDNMIIQRLDSFSIINGRAIGQITFTATDSFNPYYYNKNITNIIQFKTPNGINILPFVKQNTLRFTATERTETIQYDEGMNDNTRASVESFVWSGVTEPTPFSKSLKFEIVTAPTNGEPIPIPKVQTSGFMGAGIAGAIAGLILIGFIADHKRGK